MRDKTVTRCIDFTKEDIQRLNKLALERNEILEDYLAEMIPKYLLPMLESEFLSHQSEEAHFGRAYKDYHDHLQAEIKLWRGVSGNNQFTDYGELLNGHTSKIFPVLVAVRVLMKMLIESGTVSVPYQQYRDEAFLMATKLKRS